MNGKKIRRFRNTARLTAAVIGIAAAGSATAAPLTPEEALARVNAEGVARKIASGVTSTQPIYTELTQAGTPGAYVFERGPQGFLVVSADDIAYPVLGYGEMRIENSSELPPALKWWLGEYAAQIEYASGKGARRASAAPKVNDAWEAIEPLVKTRWDQSEPYNKMCPESGGNLCVTGCVATSMAQVMNYFKYPEKGEGRISYRADRINKTLRMDLSEQSFSWDEMLNEYVTGAYTESQADAVAYLMKACGYSVEMNYSPSVSGATGEDIANALRTNFFYDGGCYAQKRILTSWDNWSELIYNNLKTKGPVIINGQSPLDGGHSFVCDGYDGNGYFHFNWGWGGMSDGYYALDALNPTAQGIGGYEGGFNFSQNAILGICKPTGETPVERPARLLAYGALRGEITGNVLEFSVNDYSPCGWGNAIDREIKVRVGAMFEPIDGTPGETEIGKGRMGSMSTITLPNGSYYNSSVKAAVNIPSLSDGKYKVVLSCIEAGDKDADWLPVAVPWGYPDYVYLEVNGGNYTVTNISPAMLTFDNLSVLTPLYDKKNALFKVTIKNDTEYDITRGASPALLKDGKVVMVGGSFLVTLKAGETVEHEWVSKFLSMDGAPTIKNDTELTLGMYDPETHLVYDTYGTVTIMPAPKRNASVTLTGFSIEGAKSEEMTIGDRNYPSVKVVDELDDFTVDFGIKVNLGYFDGQIALDICEPAEKNPNSLIKVTDALFSDVPFLSADESKDYEVAVKFPQGEKDQLYFLRLTRSNGSTMTEVGRLAFMWTERGSVDSIGVDSEAEPEYYNLQGNRVINPEKGDILIERRGGKIRKIVW